MITSPVTSLRPSTKPAKYLVHPRLSSAFVTHDSIFFPFIATRLKLVDLHFVERMGDCHRLTPQPAPLTADATVVYRWRLDAEPVGCRLSQANMVASLCALRLSTQRVMGEEDTYLSYVPLAHIFERSMLLLCLISGAQIGFFHGETQKLFEDAVRCERNCAAADNSSLLPVLCRTLILAHTGVPYAY